MFYGTEMLDVLLFVIFDSKLPDVEDHEEVKENVDESQQTNVFSSLKEVADQVILNNILEDIEEISKAHETPVKEVEKVTAVAEEKLPESFEACVDELLEDTEGQEDKEESASPSQSDRSTRWEALADIAAELPPSLAVDPITGQIYSLTK